MPAANGLIAIVSALSGPKETDVRRRESSDQIEQFVPSRVAEQYSQLFKLIHRISLAGISMCYLRGQIFW